MARKKGHCTGPHKYHRVKIDNGFVWACDRPACGHWMPANLVNLLVGKLSTCWSCESPFQLNELNMRDVRPTCPDCSEEMTILNFNKPKQTVEELESANDDAPTEMFGEIFPSIKKG